MIEWIWWEERHGETNMSETEENEIQNEWEKDWWLWNEEEKGGGSEWQKKRMKKRREENEEEIEWSLVEKEVEREMGENMRIWRRWVRVRWNEWVNEWIRWMRVSCMRMNEMIEWDYMRMREWMIA